MSKLKTVISLMSFLWVVSAYGNAFPANEPGVEEVPYDQVIRELNARVNRHERQRAQPVSTDPYENMNIHVSLGLVQTVNNLIINDRATSRLEDGIQLGVGLDLFAKEWVAEGILKNYGQSKQNQAELSLREFDLRLNYLQSAPAHKMKIRVINGVGTRYLRYRNDWSQIDQHVTTPVYLLGMGFVAPLTSKVNLDIEIQSHLNLISDTMDRHGLGVAMKLDNVF
jgi:hypothetical protein